MKSMTERKSTRASRFTKEFKEHSIAWISITTLVAVLSGIFSSWLTYQYKRQEIIDNLKAELDKTREVAKIEEEKERKERVRKEVVRWANPILGSETVLSERLHNILERGGDLALTEVYKEQTNRQWSITNEYFLESTLFLFGEYFSRIQMLKDELNFELFQSQAAKDELFKKIDGVERALAEFPPSYKCQGSDVQVFELQQRAIGELMMERRPDGSRTVMTYPDFTRKLDDPFFKKHFEPLRALLQEIKPSEECRRLRLKETKEALDDLQETCQQLLNVPQN